ncbi:PREDICTED: calmodulin-binding receptor-like cytoplasmic kinase 2 [Nicotiana attenuata]|uniref:non-specific serine/threonine protein kinase n=1 Tax=Nicotiana attenuata TaxID=49451 RepID=A0A314L8A7_NICAT|nr:PREDICTED: calmodulin-binding receptor-like cytoplasmic kinase 2 [Nicotiana attenuata]OIT37785.1 calmodulin-binding receptor-like cytoplasmic kinase 2 [Nicotiana attenuata]
MKSPNSLFSGRRRSSSGTGSISSSYMTHSPSTSTYSSTTTSSNKSTSGQNPVKIAAKTVAEAFVSCFTPPEPKPSSNDFGDSSDSFKAPSVASDGGSEKRRSRGGSIYGSENNSIHAKEAGSVKFTMGEIYKATRNFSPSLKIGQGGFGIVYKGRLEDGTVVAIKRAKNTIHDKHLGVEFQSEVRTLEKIEHLNLVKFYGYLERGEERIIVVEYVPNGTLREHLDCGPGNVLDFASRLDIGIDVGHAITYLHMYTDHPIIHRDIKSSNILLTENLRAKVADFGFARLAADTESGATHVSTQVKGTAGYLDPEYLSTYQLTEKSDVYSFGVLLVELVTGRRPIEPKREIKERITARWAMKKFTNGDAILTLDPRLERSAANSLAMEKIYELALQCLAPHRHNRPTMRKCAEILWSIRKDYRELAG